MRARQIVGGVVLAAVAGAGVLLTLDPAPAVAARTWAYGVEVPPLAPQGLPACEVEDASSGPIPCLWDAASAGNGQGHSFWVGRPTRQDPDRRPIFHPLATR